MSLKFVFGASGSGKSTYLYQNIIERAAKNRKKNFFVVVPDQFTMQTQKDLVCMSPGNCILNIDVLSFSRLSHRIFEELGYDERPVLDDTGKSLILRKITAEIEKELPVLGKNLHKIGYIHEVKSTISEFMQYGVGMEEMDTLLSMAEGNGALYYKLKDLKTIYAHFKEYLEEKFITKEETLDILAEKIGKSALLKDSVVVFDGFTGFTPIQYRVLRRILKVAEEVNVTLTIPASENPYLLKGENDLFYMTRKTVDSFVRICEEEQILQLDDVRMPDSSYRFANPKGMLSHLEKNLFRIPFETMPVNTEIEVGHREIRTFEAKNPRDEVCRLASLIRGLIREEGYQYRDITVLVGDVNAYAKHIEEMFKLYEIPIYIDTTNALVLNPVIEFIRSGLQILNQNFTYDSVFHFLRSGITDFLPEEIDELENYCIRFNVRGKKQYLNAFTKQTKEMKEDAEAFVRLNGLRERFCVMLEPLLQGEKNICPAKERVLCLRNFMEHNDIESRILAIAAEFKEHGKEEKCSECEQIYGKIIALLDQIQSLLGEEEISLEDFADIMDAGIAEIRIGSIPQSVDRVIVGDNQRSRLRQTKALFFLGVNDGYIPSRGAKGNLLSDLERQILQKSEVELSPNGRSLMYMQRFYLYLNLSKPSHRLYLSYSTSGNDGKGLKPSYLIATMKKLFPGQSIEEIYEGVRTNEVETIKQSKLILAELYRDYAAGTLKKADEDSLKILICLYKHLHLEDSLSEIENNAWYQYKDKKLSEEMCQKLYGELIYSSISRIEKFGECAYAYFLKYGMGLKERENFDLTRADYGTMAHDVLNEFHDSLEREKLRWNDFTIEQQKRLVSECIRDVVSNHNEAIVFDSARNAFMVDRLTRVLNRSISNIQHQIQAGTFEPTGSEFVIQDTSDSSSMKFSGRVDRIDVCEHDGKIYIRVVDYKTGNKEFEASKLYYGLQLQLFVYMKSLTISEAKKHPTKEVIPAAMLYSHVHDAVIEESEPLSEDELSEKISDEYKMKGVVLNDSKALLLMDRDIDEGKSSVLPMDNRKKAIKENMVFSLDEIETMLAYSEEKMERQVKEIQNGMITLNPIKQGNDENGMNSCKYCEFCNICGFEEELGNKYRMLPKMEKEEAIGKMQEELQRKEQKQEQEERKNGN